MILPAGSQATWYVGHVEQGGRRYRLRQQVFVFGHSSKHRCYLSLVLDLWGSLTSTLQMDHLVIVYQ